MDAYDVVIELVVENPRVDDGEFAVLAADRGLDGDRSHDLLGQAVATEDILMSNERYWVMRKGKYAYHEYDHPETERSSLYSTSRIPPRGLCPSVAIESFEKYRVHPAHRCWLSLVSAVR